MSTTTAWRSPSNIALVKYWGKYPGQIPANPSISFTLQNCFTETRLTVKNGGSTSSINFDLWLEGEKKESFKPKVAQFFASLGDELKFLSGYRLEIHTHNSFPHSSGIASSASGMSALALCLLQIKEEIQGPEADFFRSASHWARLGSGSASRSVYGPLALWGRYTGLPHSSDEYALPYTGKIDPVFNDFCDYILLVETGQKAVSSTAGHGLMQGHPYAAQRFEQAQGHMDQLLAVLATGDLAGFGALVESEALSLHAMMMTSKPYFLLMKPQTLAIIEKIWALRHDTKLPVYFTLDAGANIHLLFPTTHRSVVEDWLQEEIVSLLKDGRYLRDTVGRGPEKITV